MPFEFGRLQFPVALCFAMTFKAVGVYLSNESFTHEMLYVTLSWVGSPDCLTLLVRVESKTHNVGYSEVSN